jgi:hypothetical protein
MSVRSFGASLRPYPTRATFGLAATLLTFGLLPPAVAEAQHAGVDIRRPFRGQRPSELNLHAGLSHRGVGPAAGLRFAIPIVQNGFVTSIDNAIYFTFGGDVFFERCIGGCGKNDDDYGVALAIPLTGRWQFNFNPDWSAYAEIGPNLYVHTGWLGGGKFPGFGHIADAWFVGTVGGKWHFAPDASLTLSLGAPYSYVGLDLAL